jgi:hypothetical protein
MHRPQQLQQPQHTAGTSALLAAALPPPLQRTGPQTSQTSCTQHPAPALHGSRGPRCDQTQTMFRSGTPLMQRSHQLLQGCLETRSCNANTTLLCNRHVADTVASGGCSRHANNGCSLLGLFVLDHSVSQRLPRVPLVQTAIAPDRQSRYLLVYIKDLHIACSN